MIFATITDDDGVSSSSRVDASSSFILTIICVIECILIKSLANSKKKVYMIDRSL